MRRRHKLSIVFFKYLVVDNLLQIKNDYRISYSIPNTENRMRALTQCKGSRDSYSKMQQRLISLKRWKDLKNKNQSTLNKCKNLLLVKVLEAILIKQKVPGKKSQSNMVTKS